MGSSVCTRTYVSTFQEIETERPAPLCRLRQSATQKGISRRFLASDLVLVGSRREGFEELNRVVPYDRLFPLGERSTQFRHGDILQLPDPLSGHSEFLSNFFESFRFAPVQPESLEDNLALGSRIVLLWFASARLIDCLIHQAL